MNNNQIRGLQSSVALDSAVQYGLFLSMLPFSYDIVIGDVISSTQVLPSANIRSRNNVVTGANITVHSSNDQTVTITLDQNILPDANYIVTASFRSTRNVLSGVTLDNDIGMPVVYNRGTGVF